MRLGFGKRSLSEAVKFYVKTGSADAALALYLIARHGKMSITRLLEELRRRRVDMSKPRLSSLIVRWKMHRFVDTCGRGVYCVSSDLEVSEPELEKARQVLAESLGLVE